MRLESVERIRARDELLSLQTLTKVMGACYGGKAGNKALTEYYAHLNRQSGAIADETEEAAQNARDFIQAAMQATRQQQQQQQANKRLQAQREAQRRKG